MTLCAISKKYDTIILKYDSTTTLLYRKQLPQNSVPQSLLQVSFCSNLLQLRRSGMALSIASLTSHKIHQIKHPKPVDNHPSKMKNTTIYALCSFGLFFSTVAAYPHFSSAEKNNITGEMKQNRLRGRKVIGVENVSLAIPDHSTLDPFFGKARKNDVSSIVSG